MFLKMYYLNEVNFDKVLGLLVLWLIIINDKMSPDCLNSFGTSQGVLIWNIYKLLDGTIQKSQRVKMKSDNQQLQTVYKA